jgi:zinc transporter, ZIP family
LFARNTKNASLFLFLRKAVAAGMMISASLSLFLEACMYADPHDTSSVSPTVRALIGVAMGLGFILLTKQFLDQHQDFKVAGLGGTDARKALLIFLVMTLHSFSEGVGVGVSFGGVHGSELGMFISVSMAVHNVPEGLAMAVALLPRGVTLLSATLWAISTSLPQPFMAVPAYLFVYHFLPFLPVGLGFAGGAMAWVAVFELLFEAIEATDVPTTIVVMLLSLALMTGLQVAIGDETKS